MFQRQRPYREGLELSVPCPYATFILIIKLTETNRHFTATRARRSDNDKGAFGLHIIVFPESLVRGYERHIVWIALDEIMTIGLYIITFKTLLKGYGSRLTVIMCDNYRTDHKPTILEFSAKTEHVLVISDSEISAFFIFLYIGCTNDDNNLDAIAYFLKHAQLAVGLKSRKHTAGVMIVEELSSQFEVQLAIELGDSLFDMFRLNGLILLVVKSYFHCFCKIWCKITIKNRYKGINEKFFLFYFHCEAFTPSMIPS